MSPNNTSTQTGILDVTLKNSLSFISEDAAKTHGRFGVHLDVLFRQLEKKMGLTYKPDALMTGQDSVIHWIGS
jgi:hypothetical protein